ncbi:50S ribosomal protein L4 [Candidatus Pacearchaeota archaeon CG06_land_8_20_14_3_00_35_12]|nr:MAG: 50S ribosomal protein L4 [Candidatus Pacearchaeota archaeon CG06_land_8_20_14_3_00_35_12]
MKSQILDISGNRKKEVELPSCFEETVREDLIAKSYRVSSLAQRTPNGNWRLSGMEASAHGKLSHMRGRWKTQYGHGISRVPRKIMSRSGDRFNWVGAFASGTKGGREAHPPKSGKVLSKIISKKERAKALRTAIAALASFEWIKKKYSTLNKKEMLEKFKIMSFPIILESKINEIKKTKELVIVLKKILNDFYESDKKILIITNNKSNLKKMNAVEVTTPKEMNILQIANGGVPGRIAIFTEDAIEEMQKMPKFK